MPPSQIHWDELEPLVSEAFHIWTTGGDSEWARRAWDVLAGANLTRADDGLDRLRVFGRFLVLASFYRDWCSLACDENMDDEPSMWMSGAEVSDFHLGQLVGGDVDVDPEDGLNDAWYHLMAQERPKVGAALLNGMGGVEGLFVSLWRSLGGFPAGGALR